MLLPLKNMKKMQKIPITRPKNEKFHVLGSRDVEVPGPNFVFIYIMISVNNHHKLKAKVLHLGLIEPETMPKMAFFTYEKILSHLPTFTHMEG